MVHPTRAAYNIPTGGLTNESTYVIPLQVDASALSSGVYTYTMTVIQNFGSGVGATSITTTAQGQIEVINASTSRP